MDLRIEANPVISATGLNHVRAWIYQHEQLALARVCSLISKDALSIKIACLQLSSPPHQELSRLCEPVVSEGTRHRPDMAALGSFFQHARHTYVIISAEVSLYIHKATGLCHRAMSVGEYTVLRQIGAGAYSKVCDFSCARADNLVSH